MTACPAGVTDPDCRCVADGACVTTCGSGVIDPDCGCGADGACVASCGSDPDCATCGDDGVCSTAACPGGDPDCRDDGDVCTTAEACPGRECVADPRGFSFCSRACTSSDECLRAMTCQAGRCRSAPDVPEAPVQGGCAAAAAGPLALLLLLLGARRPRR